MLTIVPVDVRLPTFVVPIETTAPWLMYIAWFPLARILNGVYVLVPICATPPASESMYTWCPEPISLKNALPPTLREPVNWWVSSVVSPKIVEPLLNDVVIWVTDDDTM